MHNKIKRFFSTIDRKLKGSKEGHFLKVDEKKVARPFFSSPPLTRYNPEISDGREQTSANHHGTEVYRGYDNIIICILR